MVCVAVALWLPLGHAVRRCACPLIPWWFFAKLLVFFALTYLVLAPRSRRHTHSCCCAPRRIGVWLSEFSPRPVWSHPTMLLISPARSATAIFYLQRNLFGCTFSPQGMPLTCQMPPQGIPAEWIMANLVLLVPLMLATPAPSWRARVGRLALALGIALVLQVFDVVIGDQITTTPPPSTARSGRRRRQIYQFRRRLRAELGYAALPLRHLGRGALPPAAAARGLQPTPAATPAAAPAAVGSRAERRRQGRVRR